jgi:hypothetical protein
MKSVNTFCDNLKASAAQPVCDNERGNTIYRAFLPSERYRIDFADDFTAEGWLQFDTDQDAEYFGVWVNPVSFRTLTYAEGDWSIVECHDAGHYNSEVADAIRFYGEGFEFKTVGPEGITEYRQDRSRFLVAV